MHEAEPIVCALADHAHATRLASLTRRYAEVLGAQARFVHVPKLEVPPSPALIPLQPAYAAAPPRGRRASFVDDLVAYFLAQGEATLDRVGIAPDERRVAVGNPVSGLLRMIAEEEPMFTIVGAPGHGRVKEALIGSVSGALIRYSDQPVMVIRPDALAEAEAGPVICAVNGGLSEDGVLVDVGRRLAERSHRELVLGHIVGGRGGALLAERAFDDRSSATGSPRTRTRLAPTLELRRGSPAQQVAALARDVGASLVAVGARRARHRDPNCVGRCRASSRRGPRARGSGLDQPVADRVARQLDPVAHPQLLEDVRAVPLDRLAADHELLGDLLVGVGLGDELHDLCLPWCQRILTRVFAAPHPV